VRNHIFKVGGPIQFLSLGYYYPSTEKKLDRSTQFGAVGYIITLYSSKSYVKSWGFVQILGGPDPLPQWLHPWVRHFLDRSTTLTRDIKKKQKFKTSTSHAGTELQPCLQCFHSSTTSCHTVWTAFHKVLYQLRGNLRTVWHQAAAAACLDKSYRMDLLRLTSYVPVLLQRLKMTGTDDVRCHISRGASCLALRGELPGPARSDATQKHDDIDEHACELSSK